MAEADAGISALDAIRTHSPQVALLDHHMPGMDGAEVAAAAQRDELPTRVLLVAAHGESAIVFRAPRLTIRRLLRRGTNTRLGDSAAVTDRPDRRADVDLGGRPLAAGAVRGDPRCVRGGAVLWLMAVLKGPVPRWGIGRRRPSSEPSRRRAISRGGSSIPNAMTCRRCWPRGSNSMRHANAIPIPRSIWSTRRCKKPRRDCARPSPSCTLRCWPSSASPAAQRELLRQCASRTDLAVVAELEDVGKPESQALLYRATRILLTNIGKHAKATTVWVGLMRKGDRIVSTIDDDGAGLDPAIVAQYVADGHIGLDSPPAGSRSPHPASQTQALIESKK